MSTSRQSRITQFASKIERSGSGTTGLQPKGNGTGRNAESLFLEDKTGAGKLKVAGGDNFERERSPTPTADDIWGTGEDNDSGILKEHGEERFNENGSAVKRRRVDSSSPEKTVGDATNGSKSSKPKQSSGPFIEDSDSEDDLGLYKEVEEPSTVAAKAEETNANGDSTGVDTLETEERPIGLAPPSLVREAMSNVEDDEFPNFDDVEDGEFQEEEGSLEHPLEEDEKEQDHDVYDPKNNSPGMAECEERGNEVAVCPICQGSLAKLKELVRCFLCSLESNIIQILTSYRTSRYMSIIASMENPMPLDRLQNLTLLHRVQRPLVLLKG